jgi:hypothetical protein
MPARDGGQGEALSKVIGFLIDVAGATGSRWVKRKHTNDRALTV